MTDAAEDFRGLSPAQREIQDRAIGYIRSVMGGAAAQAGGTPRGMILGPDGKAIPPGLFGYSKRAAGNSGSLRNWRPRPIYSDDMASRERETIQARICDLVGSDPHAAGVVNAFPQTVIGAGLTAYPSIDDEILDDITRAQADDLEDRMRLVMSRWWPHADACGRMHMGQIQYLWEKCQIQYGEDLTLVHMRKRPGRRYQLCLRVINPMRMKTPSDKRKLGIMDGVEINKKGEPVAVWIKTSAPGKPVLSDAAKNFIRVDVMRGHRWQVLHNFVTEDPEQYRGNPPLASCLKGFRDFSDFLDAELVSNVVTAAFAVFIELKNANPMDGAANLASFYDAPSADAAGAGKTEQTRYQEMVPGTIMYGNTGEIPHALSANRPGATFEPFTKTIKKAFSHGLGIPYPVLFKDVDGVSHAGFRSAMLEAWRVFSWRRANQGATSQKVRKMLLEEAYLMGDFDVPGGPARWYSDMDVLCAAEWFGAPKGDIEPYKAVKSDLLMWENNIKPLERIILEHGGGYPASVMRQIEREKKELQRRGLTGGGENSQSAADRELSGNAGASGISDADAAVIAEAVAETIRERE